MIESSRNCAAAGVRRPRESGDERGYLMSTLMSPPPLENQIPASPLVSRLPCREPRGLQFLNPQPLTCFSPELNLKDDKREESSRLEENLIFDLGLLLRARNPRPAPDRSLPPPFSTLSSCLWCLLSLVVTAQFNQGTSY